MLKRKTCAIIGGGAAGFFFAVNGARLHPHIQFTIYEQGKQGLQKVKISGGGRCNVTHFCFDPKELSRNYPRGEKELLGPFHQFGPSETITWFNERGVTIHKESDGRMFPTSNSSQSIIDCLINEAQNYGVEINYSSKVKSIHPNNKGRDGYLLRLLNGTTVHCNYLFIATGSSKMIWRMLEELDIQTVPAVPSLFTFLIKDPRIHGLAGITIEETTANHGEFTTSGPLLITHKGLSGPSVLKLSAFGAREFAKLNYQSKIKINFKPDLSIQNLKEIRDRHGKLLLKDVKWKLPKRLSASLLHHSSLDLTKKMASLSNKELEIIYATFCEAVFTISGQNTFKDEFVTAGGIDLSEVNFSSFSSKKYKNLYFAGEVLNIDAVTGGFNFQAAWTGAFLAAKNLN